MMMKNCLTLLALTGAVTAQQVMKLVTDADAMLPEPNLSYPGDYCCTLWKASGY